MHSVRLLTVNIYKRIVTYSQVIVTFNNQQSCELFNRDYFESLLNNRIFLPKNPKICDPILVTLLKMQAQSSQSSRENATPPSGTSPLASYKEVPPPLPSRELRHKIGIQRTSASNKYRRQLRRRRSQAQEERVAPVTKRHCIYRWKIASNLRHSEPLRKMDLLTYFLTYTTVLDDNLKAETTKIDNQTFNFLWISSNV